MVLGDGTEVRRGSIYEHGEWEKIGEVRKQTDIPLHYPPLQSAASRCVKIARRSPDLL
jgi:hypothetical protein